MSGFTSGGPIETCNEGVPDSVMITAPNVNAPAPGLRDRQMGLLSESFDRSASAITPSSIAAAGRSMRFRIDASLTSLFPALRSSVGSASIA